MIIPEEDVDLNAMLESINPEAEIEPTPDIPIIPVIEPILLDPLVKQPDAPIINSEEAPDVLGLKAMLQTCCAAAQNIVTNHAADRAQIELAIVYFETTVKAMQSAGERPSAPFVEGWVTLLQTKADINTNATKVVDSMAKLLAAAKNNNIILNFSNSPKSMSGGDGIDLNKLLAQDVEQYDDLAED